MKVLILYRPNSEHARLIEEFMRDFQRQHSSVMVETQSLDTREGAATASLYDVVSYPAILAIREEGSPLQVWQGMQLPLMNEVASYV